MKVFPGTGSLAGRLSLWTGVTAGVVMVALVALASTMTREQILRQTNSEAVLEVESFAAQVDAYIMRAAVLAKTMAALQAARGPKPPPDVFGELRQLLGEFPRSLVFGVYYAFDGVDFRDPLAMPWVDRRSFPGAVVNRNPYDRDTPDTVWFWQPKKTGRISLSEPYFDEGGSDVAMLSVNAPIIGADGRFIGVSGVDMALDEVRRLVGLIDLELAHEAGIEDDFAFLLSARGRVIVHPREEMMLGRNRPGADANDLPLGREIMASPSGHAEYGEGDGRRILFWAQAPVTGWRVVLDAPEHAVMAPVRSLILRNGLVVVAGLILLSAVSALVARRVTAPLKELTGASAALEAGRHAEVELAPLLGRTDEVGDLGRAFHHMAGEIRLREQRLAAWNANLETTVSERTAELKAAVTQLERLRAQEQAAFAALQESQSKLAGELAEAAAYVQSVLPAPLASGPVRTAWVFEPSSSLGGDAFDYGPLPGAGRFGIYLLDVCGHGVGAALLSISVLNFLRADTIPGVDLDDPGLVLGALNTAFPMERNREMFFTAWCGIYEPSNRLMRFSGGGHPPAVLLRADGSTALLAAPGPVIGALPGMRFATREAPIPAGARLFVFSDGACEIARADGSMMTHEDFRGLLARAPAADAVPWIMNELRSINPKKVFDDDVSLVEFFFP